MSIAGIDQVKSLVGWFFLPSLLSNGALRALYFLSPSHRPVVDASSTPTEVSIQNNRAQRHHRNARIALVTFYLLYTTLSVYWQQARGDARNYYALTELSRDVVDSSTAAAAIKSHWRRLARVYHPDKVGSQGEPHFVALRHALDVLESDGKRWAYERFGANAVAMPAILSQREYMMRGLLQSASFYIVSTITFTGMAFLDFGGDGSIDFWRFVSLAVLFCAETSIVTSSTPIWFFDTLLPDRLPYEHVQFMHQLFIAVVCALAQLLPLLVPAPPTPTGSPAQIVAQRAQLDAARLIPLISQLEQHIKITEQETIQLQLMELIPVLSQPTPPTPASEIFGVMSQEELAERQAARKAEQLKTYQANFEALKITLLSTFGDNAFRTHPEVGIIWQQAVAAGLTKESEAAYNAKNNILSGDDAPPEVDVASTPSSSSTIDLPPSRRRSSSTATAGSLPQTKLLSRSYLLPPALSTSSGPARMPGVKVDIGGDGDSRSPPLLLPSPVLAENSAPPENVVLD